MPFEIVTSDIVSIDVDAVIYAETKQPFSMFQFNPLILNEKGRELPKSRETLGHLAPGDAKIVPASKIAARYIIHTSAPVWHGGLYHELDQLHSCYEKAFTLAAKHDCKSIALPIIATDGLGYPKKTTREMAFSCINRLLKNQDIMVYLLLPKRISVILPGNQYVEVNKYIEKYQKQNTSIPSANSSVPSDFHGLLTEFMKKKGMTTDEICTNGNISPSTLTKLLNKEDCTPSKTTVLALGIALKLTWDEMINFAAAAGYSFDGCSRSDFIIEYCFSKGIYDIWNINQILFRFEEEQIIGK